MIFYAELETCQLSCVTLQGTELKSHQMCGKLLFLDGVFESAINPLPQVHSSRNVPIGFHCLKDNFVIQSMTPYKSIYLSKHIIVSVLKYVIYDIDMILKLLIQEYKVMDFDLVLKISDPRMPVDVFLEQLDAKVNSKLSLIAILSSDKDYKG